MPLKWPVESGFMASFTFARIESVKCHHGGQKLSHSVICEIRLIVALSILNTMVPFCDYIADIGEISSGVGNFCVICNMAEFIELLL